MLMLLAMPFNIATTRIAAILKCIATMLPLLHHCGNAAIARGIAAMPFGIAATPQYFPGVIDPGSTRTLVSEEFVNKHSIPMLMGSHIRIELANGQIEIPIGELLEPQRIKIAGISTTLDLPIVRSRGVYDLLLGRNWL